MSRDPGSNNFDPDGEEPVFSRPYVVDKISAKGVSGQIEASESEREQIARTLDLSALESFQIAFQLRRIGNNHFKFTGKMVALATQTCVVSLKPLPTRVDEKIENEFRPAEEVARIEVEADPEDLIVPLDGPEPILDGVIDIGQLAYEHLAASLDPYPKEVGAQFEWDNPDAAEDGSADKPFAGLARLKGLGSSSSE